ncbi:hypothetical protein QFC21_000297 [Naganishia friedmannii]|uniref:Uncharacterized protein n=1 Tax=Naganishia friedmannii TaxID=89922 RepID=A0ACC2WCS3_9TREE|nr:hypothetical protein QFC21_000297 [Naganishia friedmannii]
MSDQLQKGDEVSWNWGGGKPFLTPRNVAAGTVAEIKEGRAEVKSNKGAFYELKCAKRNTIAKNGTPDDPAVVIERSGNNVVKRAHELNEVESEE